MKFYLFYIPFIVGITVQGLKVCIDYFKYRKLYRSNLRSAGGFPSVHGALSTSVMVLVGLVDGIESTLFLAVSIFAFLLWYDATNVRYEAGRHAHYINMMRHEFHDLFKRSSPKQDVRPILNERIGHTPFEVAGGVLFGSVITIILYYTIF